MLEKIKQLCKENNTTLKQLERDIKIGNGTIAKWNKATPKVTSLQKVANYFNVSVDYLLQKD